MKTVKEMAKELHKKCAEDGYVITAACVSPDDDDIEMVLCSGHGNEILAAICLQIQHLSQMSGMGERELLKRIRYALATDKEF